MHPRLFRLIETHQRIDRALRDEQRSVRPDPLRLTQLNKLKLRVKDLTRQFMLKAAMA